MLNYYHTQPQVSVPSVPLYKCCTGSKTTVLYSCIMSSRVPVQQLLTHTKNGTVLTIRLGLDEIETKGYGTGRSSTYTTRLRLCRIKVVTIRGKTSTVLRVWQGQMVVR